MLICTSCGEFFSPQNQDLTSIEDSQQDTISNISDSDYLMKVDAYVNSIRENIERTTISKCETTHEKMVIFVENDDTVRISVLADSNNTNTDIYFQNSTPVFITRDIILDVDSNYLETAYFKHGNIFKCFRDGQEITDRNYLKQFEETLGDK